VKAINRICAGSGVWHSDGQSADCFSELYGVSFKRFTGQFQQSCRWAIGGTNPACHDFILPPGVLGLIWGYTERAKLDRSANGCTGS
jgi:hypothetical protein